MRNVVICLLLMVMLASSGLAQDQGKPDSGKQYPGKPDPDTTEPADPHAGHDMNMSNSDDSGQMANDANNQDMHGMDMNDPSFLPSPHAGSGTGWQPASIPAHIWMTTHGRLGPDGSRRVVCQLQPARRPARRREGRIGQLFHADGTTPAGPGYDFVSRDVFRGVNHRAAARLPGNFSNGRELIMASLWSTISIPTICLPNWPCYTPSRWINPPNFPGYFTEARQPSLR